jgi:hypothetical protein
MKTALIDILHPDFTREYESENIIVRVIATIIIPVKFLFIMFLMIYFMGYAFTIGGLLMIPLSINDPCISKKIDIVIACTYFIIDILLIVMLFIKKIKQ